MTEAVDQGITVTEIAAMDQSIDVLQETTAAFVGRALRGPLNTPILLRNFGEYRRHFGDNPSRFSLGSAAKQFFEHGGQRLYVVRVANNARGAMLCLPAYGSAAVLRAVEPGSAEHLRAAVDYDAISDDSHFNLTLQRIDPQTGLVLDQELFSKLSYDEGADNFIGDALLASSLARLEHPYPTHRPEATVASDERFGKGYIDHAQAGTDGSELSDYDLVGSRKAHTGLFALEDAEHFDVLYLPPLGRAADVGPAAILAAELYCRRRGAMLIVDPRAEWSTGEEAIEGVRGLGYASPNMFGYFPRVVERGAPNEALQHAGGAISGLLCKHDRTYGAWHDLNQQGMGLQRALIPALRIDEENRQLLNRAGLNVLTHGPAGRARIIGSVTMGRGAETHREYAGLPVRRFCLRIANTIAKALQWAVFEPADIRTLRRIRAQVLTYLSGLDELGAFVDSRFSVRCDATVGQQSGSEPHGITILLAFHPLASDDEISLTLHITARGCRVVSTAFAPTVEQDTAHGSSDFT